MGEGTGIAGKRRWFVCRDRGQRYASACGEVTGENKYLDIASEKEPGTSPPSRCAIAWVSTALYYHVKLVLDVVVGIII